MIRDSLFRIGVCLLAVSGSIATDAIAQEYPTKPIRLIVAFPPGGGADAISRLVGQKLAQELGQPVIVENKPGAGGTIGSDSVGRSLADGYTLLVGPASQVIAPNFYKMNVDPIKGFEPITQMVSALIVLAASKERPESSYAEFVDTVKKNSNAGVIASSGVGTVFHLSGARLATASGVQLQHIAYKGGGPAVTDLVAGHVPVMIDTYFTFKPFAATERVKLWATLGSERSSLLPNIPTLNELGYKGVVAENWYGLFAPAGTPTAIVQRLAEKTRSALHDPELVARLAEQGAVPVGSTPVEFKTFLDAESAKWAEVIRINQIKGN
ncbi:Bug family tripartite tricarboxylate transporter substrate binding protein [Schauerella aestuarii]|uniref:Bug family tripartite tricarboxylate transporter substrate binding protein n=1 Tax=Schauerella aestuarii TaxID=2511204 RepID=UPI001367C2A4|nr:tripartite tricarboxylate transporter substrate binding protein [Achromobacter aestuarii]MYZ44742.1 tripartite tricarboxylate transporter substrate binding protein [Achromobacter aestuarii]